MTKHIELKRFNQATAPATGTLAFPPLVIEGLEEFKGSFDRLCLQAGTAAIEAMLAADAERLCGKRYQRHADRQGHRWGTIDSEVGWRQGGYSAATGACAWRHRTGSSQLDGDPEGGPSVALGVQPDADRRGDAQICALGPTAGRRSGWGSQARHDEIFGLAAVCGAEHGEAEGMAGG
jgi:hypothetical protein